MAIAGTGSFIRRLVLLAGGTAAGQVIALAAAPLITRLYDAGDFGVLGVYMSALTLIGAVAALRYESAIPVSESDEEAVNVIALAWLAAGATALLVAGAVVLFGPWILARLNIGPYRSFCVLLPIGVFLAATYQILSMWTVRKQDYATLARTKLSQNAGMVAVQTGLGLLVAGPAGLMAGHMVGQSGGALTIARRVWRQNRALLRALSPRGMRQVARRYRRFPKFSVGATLLSSTSGVLPLFYIAAAHGPLAAGWFTLVQRYFYAPLGMLSLCITQIHFGELADLRSAGPCQMKRLFLRRLKQLSLLGALLTLALALPARWVFPYVFGAEWSNAAICLQLLAPALCLAFISNPLGAMLDVLQRQDLHLLWGVAKLASILAVIGCSYYFETSWTSTFALMSLGLGGGSLLYLAAASYAVLFGAVSAERANAPLVDEVSVG